MAKKKKEEDKKSYRINYDSHEFYVDVELIENGLNKKHEMFFKGTKHDDGCAFIGVINDVEIVIPYSSADYEDFEIPSSLSPISKDNMTDAVNDYLDYKDGYAC